MPSITYEEFALATLKKIGLRITMPRVMVVRALAGADTALSAYAIHAIVTGAGGSIDVVSCYRILGSLLQAGLVYTVARDGWFRREAASGILAFKGESVAEALPNPHLRKKRRRPKTSGLLATWCGISIRRRSSSAR